MTSKRIEELPENASEKDKLGINDSIEKLGTQITQIEKDLRYEKPPETHTKLEGSNSIAPLLQKETLETRARGMEKKHNRCRIRQSPKH